MSKKHFIAIAKLIKENHNKAFGYMITEPFVKELADFLATTNKNFNRDKFIDACLGDK